MNQTKPDFHRVAIEAIRPQVDGGRFAIKRIVGDEIMVAADVFSDGHEEIVALLQYRFVEPAAAGKNSKSQWQEKTFEPRGNDLWQTSFRAEKVGRYAYRVVGWVDRFHTWRHDLEKRNAAGQNLHVDLQIGSELVASATGRANGPDAAQLNELAAQIAAAKKFTSLDQAARFNVAMSQELLRLMDRYAGREHATVSHELEILVDDQRAGFAPGMNYFHAHAVPRPASTEHFGM